MEFEKILVGLDIEHENAQIIKFCLELASKSNSELIFLYAYKPSLSDANKSLESLNKSHLEQLENQVAALSDLYENVIVECSTKQGFTVDVIKEYAIYEKVDFVVLGIHQKKEFLEFDNVSLKLLRLLGLPVILIPETFRFVQLDHLVLSIDFEFEEIQFLCDLLLLMNNLGGRITCLHLSESDDKREKQRIYRNIKTYENIFERQILGYSLSFEILDDSDKKALEKFSLENEVDIIALMESRRNWRNQYFNNSSSAKISTDVNIPLLIFSE